MVFTETGLPFDCIHFFVFVSSSICMKGSSLSQKCCSKISAQCSNKLKIVLIKRRFSNIYVRSSNKCSRCSNKYRGSSNKQRTCSNITENLLISVMLLPYHKTQNLKETKKRTIRLLR